MILSFEPKRQKPEVHTSHKLNRVFTGPQAQKKAEAHVFANITGQPQYPEYPLNDKNILGRFFVKIYHAVAPEVRNITFITKMVEQLIYIGLYDEALNFVALVMQVLPDQIPLQQLWKHIQRLQTCSENALRDTSQQFVFQNGLSVHHFHVQLNALETKVNALLPKDHAYQADLKEGLTRSLYFQFKQAKMSFKRLKKQTLSSAAENMQAREQGLFCLHLALDRIQQKLETALVLLLLKTSWQHIQIELKIIHPLLGYGIAVDDELLALLEILSLLIKRLEHSVILPVWPARQNYENLKQALLKLSHNDTEVKAE